MKRQAIDLAYLACAITLHHRAEAALLPAHRALRGNQIAAFGMALAIGATLFDDADAATWPGSSPASSSAV